MNLPDFVLDKLGCARALPGIESSSRAAGRRSPLAQRSRDPSGGRLVPWSSASRAHGPVYPAAAHLHDHAGQSLPGGALSRDAGAAETAMRETGGDRLAAERVEVLGQLPSTNVTANRVTPASAW